MLLLYAPHSLTCALSVFSCLFSPTLQGLAEVLAVMGDAHLSELLPELSASATSKNPFVREGHLTLFRSVPLATALCAQTVLTLLSAPSYSLAKQGTITGSCEPMAAVVCPSAGPAVLVIPSRLHKVLSPACLCDAGRGKQQCTL